VAAIQAHDFVRAADLRDRERELLKQALQGVETRQQEVLAEVRARLGLGKEQLVIATHGDRLFAPRAFIDASAVLATASGKSRSE